MDRAAHAIITAGVTTAFHPLVYAKTLIQVRCALCVVMCGVDATTARRTKRLPFPVIGLLARVPIRGPRSLYLYLYL